MTDDDDIETENSEDRQMREDGERYAKDHAAEFCAAHVNELNALVSTYPDSEALSLFDALREQFWARLWKPRGSQKP